MAVKETVAVLMAAASEIIFDSDSSDSSDSDSPSGAITLAGFAEEVVPMFSDIEFRSHFRVKSSQVNLIFRVAYVTNVTARTTCEKSITAIQRKGQ